MGMLWRSVQILVVASFLGLYLWHISPHALRSLGQVPLDDVEQLLAAHNDRNYLFTLHPSDQPQQQLGSLQQRLGMRDTFFVLASQLRVDRVEDLALLSQLAHLGLDGELNLESELELDDRQRLVGVSASGSLGRVRGWLRGRFDHRGLSGAYRLNNGMGSEFTLSDIDVAQQTSVNFAAFLPPNLQVGDRFQQRVLQLQATPPYISQGAIRYEVLERQILDTAAGSVSCLRVQVGEHGDHGVQLWCDDNGVIYRGELPALGLAFSLRRVLDAEGDELWPLTPGSEAILE